MSYPVNTYLQSSTTLQNKNSTDYNKLECINNWDTLYIANHFINGPITILPISKTSYYNCGWLLSAAGNNNVCEN